MKSEEDIKQIIASNIVHYRKAMNLTQAEFAERLQYSDKAISKWERGESLPDIVIMRKIADMFGISLDKLTSIHQYKRFMSFAKKRRKLIIPILAAAGVWGLVTLLFSCFIMLEVPMPNMWLLFVYALPTSIVVLMIFNFIWGYTHISPILISGILWTLALSLYLSFDIPYNFAVFFIAIPIQIMLVLWYLMTIKVKKK